MQTEDKLNQVWGKPVKSVHTLQDLARLVAAQPEVQTKASGKRVLTEEQKEALRQRAKLAREVLAEKRARGEVIFPKRGKYKERKEQKQWTQATVSTSATPVKGIKREAQATPLTIDYITRMNFNYNIGRAVECLSNYDLRGAMAHLERELNK